MKENKSNNEVINVPQGSKLEQLVANLIKQRDENRKRVRDKYRKSKNM